MNKFIREESLGNKKSLLNYSIIISAVEFAYDIQGGRRED